MNFQQKGDYTCGITVCRKIIYNIKGDYIDQEEIKERIKEMKFLDENLRNNFINDKGPLPVEKLIDLMIECFGIKLEKIDNVPTADIKFDNVMVVWQYPDEIYHAVLINTIKNEFVSYLNPTSGKEESMGLLDFDSMRKPKTKTDKRNFLEILIPSVADNFMTPDIDNII